MEPRKESPHDPGDLPVTDHGNDATSSLSHDHMKGSDTLDEVQDNTTPTGAAEQTKQPSPVKDPRLHHPLSARLMPSRGANEESAMPLVSKHSIVHTKNLNETTNAVSSPVDAPDGTRPDDTTPTSLPGLPESSHRLGAMLHTYQNTASEEIKQIIGCLVSLDMAITKQTHLNELHEAHAAKNFREQRHLNKDRKLRIGTIMKSVDHRFADMDAKRMAQDTAIKQCEVRTNSYTIQLRGLNDKVKKLAEGGEWAKTEMDDIKHIITDLQREVEALKLANVDLRDEMKGLREEVRTLKERDEVWEKRLRVLEGRIDNKKQTQPIDLCVKKQRVLNAASFAVGNRRVFPFSH